MGETTVFGDIIVTVVGWNTRCFLPWSLILKQVNAWSCAYTAEMMSSSAELCNLNSDLHVHLRWSTVSFPCLLTERSCFSHAVVCHCSFKKSSNFNFIAVLYQSINFSPFRDLLTHLIVRSPSNCLISYFY